MPESNVLVFILSDGTNVKKEWNYKSRSESWSKEDREKARQRSLKMLEGRI